MNHITIELCAEDRARLDAIIEGLKDAAPRCDNCVKLVGDICAHKATETAQKSKKPKAPQTTQPKEEKPTEANVEDDSPFPEVTVEDIRSKFMQLAATDKKDQARALIKTYAEKIGEIPADKCAEVLNRLNALEG